jgi:hypothetical protein
MMTTSTKGLFALFLLCTTLASVPEKIICLHPKTGVISSQIKSASQELDSPCFALNRNNFQQKDKFVCREFIPSKLMSHRFIYYKFSLRHEQALS